MCGRYAVFADMQEEALHQFIEVLQRRQPALAVEYGEIFPTQAAVVIGMNGAPIAMRWGFPRPDGKGVIINARAESAAQRPMFRDALRYRRCLVPASGFYEWKRSPGQSLRHYIRLGAHQPMWMAGLYDATLPLPHFVIITQPANAAMSALHDRMPLLLNSQAARDAWLRDADRVSALLSNGFEDALDIQPEGIAQTSLFDLI